MFDWSILQLLPYINIKWLNAYRHVPTNPLRKTVNFGSCMLSAHPFLLGKQLIVFIEFIMKNQISIYIRNDRDWIMKYIPKAVPGNPTCLLRVARHKVKLWNACAGTASPSHRLPHSHRELLRTVCLVIQGTLFWLIKDASCILIQVVHSTP